MRLSGVGPQSPYYVPGFQPGVYYFAGPLQETNQNLGTASLGATLQAFPFSVPRVSVLEGLAVDVTAIGLSPNTVRLAVYSSNPSGTRPDKLLAASAELSTGTTGLKLTSGLAVTLHGLVWSVWFAQGNATVRAPSSTAGVLVALGHPLGSTQTLRLLQHATHPYGPLPATFPSGAVAITGNAPVVALRFA